MSSFTKFCSFSSDKMSWVPATEAPSVLPASRPRTLNLSHLSGINAPKYLDTDTHVMCSSPNLPIKSIALYSIVWYVTWPSQDSPSCDGLLQ